MANQNAVLAVLNMKDFVNLLLIAPALALKYKRLVIYVKDLPAEFQDYLKTNYNIKVINEQNCTNYDYALVVKDINIEQVKLEYKNNSVYLYLAKPDLTIDEVKLLKLRKVDRYSLNEAIPGCKIINSDYWVKYAGQLNEIWAKLYLIIKTGSILGLKRFIKSNSNLDALWRKIKVEANRGYVSVGNIQDFLNSLMLVALYNILYDTEIPIILAGTENYGCLPILTNVTFNCKQVDVDRLLQGVARQEEKGRANTSIDINKNKLLDTQQLDGKLEGLAVQLGDGLELDESNLEDSVDGTDQQITRSVVDERAGQEEQLANQQNDEQINAIHERQDSTTPEVQSTPKAELKELTRDVKVSRPKQHIIEQESTVGRLHQTQTVEKKEQLANKDPTVTEEEPKPELKSKEGEPMPIDVEKWAEHIQRMLEE